MLVFLLTVCIGQITFPIYFFTVLWVSVLLDVILSFWDLSYFNGSGTLYARELWRLCQITRDVNPSEIKRVEGEAFILLMRRDLNILLGFFQQSLTDVTVFLPLLAAQFLRKKKQDLTDGLSHSSTYNNLKTKEKTFHNVLPISQFGNQFSFFEKNGGAGRTRGL